jgi:translation initiation factor 1
MANGRSGSSSRLVYSSRSGQTCPRCEQPVARCTCTQSPRPGAAASRESDGVIRVRRETKGRRGKAVTTVSGLPLASEALRELASELKRSCSSGGSAKDGVIEIQGDHRERVVEWLRERGHSVKLAGG